MGFSRFGLAIGLRLVFILLTIAVTGFLSATPGYPVATGLALLIATLLALELFGFVTRTNREVSRFLDAARYADFGQRFEFSDLGAGFAELGATFTFILERFRHDRSRHEAELRQLKAIIEHVPVPLITLHADGHITLWNNAARRLFGAVNVTRLADLATLGAAVPRQLSAMRPTDKILLTLRIEDNEQSFIAMMSEISVAGVTQQLVSLQNIQSELEVTQLRAWQDLVRVLTHEIMNSITPVSSLAKTAVDLVEDVIDKVADNGDLVAELKDIKNAVNTVARRSDGLMNFVGSYRQLTRLPEPSKTRFLIADLFADVRRVATADWASDCPSLTLRIEPQELDLFADRQMIEQVLINLLQNAHYAVMRDPAGHIELAAHLNQRGQVSIAVLDNGPGINADIASKIFVPFYTTRKEGSGVGLALSRQIMIANGGTISFSNRKHAGARFTLAF